MVACQPSTDQSQNTWRRIEKCDSIKTINGWQGWPLSRSQPDLTPKNETGEGGSSVQVKGRNSVSPLAAALGEQVVPNVIHVLRADGAKLFMGIRVSALKSVDHYVAPVHHAGNPS